MSSRARLVKLVTDIVRLVGNPRFLAPCVAGSFMLIVGTVLGVQYLFNMASVLFAVPVASYILAVLSLRGVQIRRVPAKCTVEGVDTRLEVQVATHGLSPRLRLRLTDVLPDHMELDRPGGVEIAMCSTGSVAVDYNVRPTRRGRYRIGPILVSSRDPIGIFECRRSFHQKDYLVVYPRSQPVPLSGFSGDQRFRFGDASTSGRKGQSMDFYGVRDYVRGDDIRRIHWKTTARRGNLIVTEYEAGVSAGLVIAVEHKRGTDIDLGGEGTLDVSTRIARYVAESALGSGMSVRLFYGSGRAVTSVQADVPEDLERILFPLATVMADSDISAAEALQSADIEPGQMIVVVTSTVDPELIAFADEQARCGSRVSVVFVSSFRLGKYEEALESLNSAGADVAIFDGGVRDE